MSRSRFVSIRPIRGLIFFSIVGLLAWGMGPPVAQGQSVTPSEEELVFYTEEYDGERYESGRPKVPDGLLQRMEKVSIEQAWGVLRENGYHNQFAGDWEKIHENEPIVGRALTAQYMPSSPGLEERLAQNGREDGHDGPTNTWPIEMLNEGDVYVADGYRKVKDGTLIGDNLGTAIYANSGNGVVLNGSSRDLGGLQEIDGFNAFVRDWHPSFIQEMMLTEINAPIRIGEATVLPGDVVLAKREGIVFIPAHLAQEVVRRAEITILRDQFGHQRLREGKYTSGQIDSEWTDGIKTDFYNWLEENRADLPVPEKQVQRILDEEPL